MLFAQTVFVVSGALLSESGFEGLKDFQDSPSERVCDRQTLVGARIGEIFDYAEKRKMGETES